MPLGGSALRVGSLREGLPQIAQGRDQHEPGEPQPGRKARPGRKPFVLGAAAGGADPEGNGGRER